MTLAPLGLNNRTKVYRWTYADAAARTGDTGFTADDVGSFALQLDTGELWRLTATTPTWQALATGLTDQTTTKGDLLVRDASAVTRRAVGSNDQLLVADSAQATGIKWGVPAAFAPGGMTGATAATRYVGGTTSGAPASGTFSTGDFIITQDGSVYICTAGGSPGTWAQVSGGGGGGGGASLLLDYRAATDIANGVALTANTWTDIGTNQSFTVANASSIVQIALGGVVIVGTSGAGASSRFIVDSAGTPITRQLGGASVNPGQYENMLNGASPGALTGLSAGSHTVKMQVRSNNAGNVAYCRPATFPDESLTIQVLEFLP